MSFEEAADMFDLYEISPELTCSCDEFHICQQCMEDGEINDQDLSSFETNEHLEQS